MAISFHRNWAITLVIMTLRESHVTNSAPECPTPWLYANTKCYFFSTVQRSWLDAQFFCEKFGATLVSVNGRSKHDIVQRHLMEQGRDSGSWTHWYTRGRIVGGPRNNPTFQWLDGTGLGSSSFWKNPLSPITDTGDYITYAYSDENEHKIFPGYFWVRSSGTEYFRFICEIAVSETGQIFSEKRDFEFGSEDAKIYQGPRFVMEPRNQFFDMTVDVKADETRQRSVTFHSEAKGSPRPSYQWFEQNTNIPLSPLNSSDLTITNGILTIHNPSSVTQARGFYCKATNDLGSVLSEPARIEFRTLVEFPKKDLVITAEEWDSAVIDCKHNNPSNTRLMFDWFVNGDRTDFVDSLYNSHMFESASGSLYFSHTTVGDNNRYHCAVWLPGGREERISPSYTLQVQTGPSYRQIGPIIHANFPQVIPKHPKRGEVAYLECFARFACPTGEPALYRWERDDNRDLPQDHTLEDYDRRLIIHSVDLADEGVYTCFSSWRSQSNNKSVTLAIEAKPFFSEGGLEDQHLDQGSRLTWMCHASGKPTPTYQWLKNGFTFDETHLPHDSRTRILFSNNNQTVTFTSVDKLKDSGMYQCVATNSQGTTYSTAQLRILQFSPIFRKHQMVGEVIATEGTNTTIPCDPEAAPAATITWLKDGKLIALETGVESRCRQLPNSHLYISRVTASIDSGEYTCIAANSFMGGSGITNSVNGSVTLRVVRRTRLSYGPVDQMVRLRSRVTLECRADYDNLLELVYLWYHNNRLLDFEDWKMASIYERGIGVNRGDLIIKNVTYEERGQYKCVGQTKSDFAQLSAIVTLVGPPGEPAGLTAQHPSSHSVLLTWTKGAENGKRIFSYIIDKYNVDTGMWITAINVSAAGGDITNATIKDLFSNTGYKFRVSAQNEYGVGVPSKDSSIIQTASDRPTSYPRNIRCGSGKEGTLVIEWDLLPKEEWNAPDVTYVAQYREWRDEMPNNQGGWMNCTRVQTQLRSVTSTGNCVVTLGMNKFFTKYSVRVIARNSLGEGPTPPPIVGTSAVAVPQGTPQGIMAQPYNSTAIMVYWDAVPDDRNVHGGELLGFHVQYWQRDKTSINGRRNTIYGNVTECVIIGLLPLTEYEVTAQIMNSAGDGNAGRTMIQSTFRKAPQDMPEYVTLNLTSKNSIGVHFRGVATGPDEEPLDGYKVRLWRAGESVRSARDYDCGRRSEIILDDFIEEDEQGALYNLRVFGYSRGGVGKMSSPMLQFVKGCTINRSNSESTTLIRLCDGCRLILSVPLMCIALLIQILHLQV